MKHTVLFFLFLFSLNAIAIDYSMIPFRSGNKWGYCDSNKKIIMKPKFERTYWFADNGLARVKIADKYGFINKSGEFKFEAKYDNASDFLFNYCMVELGKQKYCLNENGELTKTNVEHSYSCSFSSVLDDGENTICINCCKAFGVKGNYGTVCKEIKYIDNDFKTIAIDSIPAQYDTIYTSIGYAEKFTPLIASKNGKFGMVTNKNKIVYPFEFDSIRVIDYNTLVLKKNNMWTLRDTSQILYSNFSQWHSYLFDSGTYFTVKISNKWGVINSKGKVVVPIQFDEIKFPSRHIIPREFTVKTNGKWGYISDQGNISSIYDLLEPFNGEQYTLVVKKGLEGYVDRKGIEYFE